MKQLLRVLVLLAYVAGFVLVTARMVGLEREALPWYAPGLVVLLLLALLLYGRATRLGAAITIALAAASIAVPVLLHQRRAAAAAAAVAERAPPSSPLVTTVPSPEPAASPTPGPPTATPLDGQLSGALASGTNPATETEADRHESVATAVVLARVVTAEPARCSSPVWLARVWKGLRRARVSDPEWAEAVQLTATLDRCRVALIAGLEEQQHRLRMETRRELARSFCQRFLVERGVALEPSIDGSAGRELTLTWPLLDALVIRRWAGDSDIERSALLAELRGFGFEKVIWADGAGGRWEYALRTAPDPDVIGLRLGELGLGRPFALPALELPMAPAPGSVAAPGP